MSFRILNTHPYSKVLFLMALLLVSGTLILARWKPPTKLPAEVQGQRSDAEIEAEMVTATPLHAKEIVRNGAPVRSVIPPSFPNKVEPSYLVQWLGGRVDESANLIAIIGEDGSVTYQMAADEQHK
jgi:hypothetical protein